VPHCISRLYIAHWRDWHPTSQFDGKYACTDTLITTGTTATLQCGALKSVKAFGEPGSNESEKPIRRAHPRVVKDRGLETGCGTIWDSALKLTEHSGCALLTGRPDVRRHNLMIVFQSPLNIQAAHCSLEDLTSDITT